MLWIQLFFLLVFLMNWRKMLKWVQKRRRLIELMEKLPGPPALPILGNIHQVSNDLEAFTYQIEYLHRKYIYSSEAGIGCFWIGPIPIVILGRAKSIKVILESSTELNKPPEYHILRELLGDGLITTSVDKWHERRRMLLPAFHFDMLCSYAEVFSSQAQILVQLLDEFADTGLTVNLLPYLKGCSLDIIAETAMGVKLNTQQRKNEEYCQAINDAQDLFFEFVRSPWLWVKPIRYLTGHKAKTMKNIAVADKLINKVLEERMRQFKEECDASKFKGTKNEEYKISYKEKPKMSFIDLLILLYKEGKLTLEQVKDELQTFMLTGHDSTALSAGFVLCALGHRPKIQEKVFDELKNILGDSDRDIAYEDTKRMKYLGQCMKEAIRMWPSIMFIGRRLTKDTDICGYTIPADTTVCISSIASHHDPEQFPLPEEFDPDHFSPENVAKRDPFAFIPFSGGVRNCIGQRFAVTEEKVVIASILRRFRIVSMMSEQENRCIPDISSKPIHGFPVRLFRR